MENQKNGYIPLYRSVLKQPWAKDVYLRTLWENLLLLAARQPYTARFKGREWSLQAGQLVVTAADLGLQLCDRKGNPTSRDAVERMLAVFVREGMISIDGEKQKGRVITITNYTEYAQKMDELPAHTTAHGVAHIPAHGKASNGAGLSCIPAHEAAHGAAQTTAQHEQEGNNNNKNITSENSDESSDSPSENLTALRAGAAVQTPKGDKWGTADDLKAAQWMFSKIRLVTPIARDPNWSAWANDVRLMRGALKASHREICEVFEWANADHFWQTNILSPAKLREKWPTLKAQMGQPGRNRQQQAPQQPEYHWNSREAWENEFL
ncbi:putative phage replication protein [Cronobacter dublinensis 1210]|uniref:Phage replication protein n=1 Tax=Cronobacter dublinensis 1210 TaxID=1208656 RepID=A0ABM9QD25_9ENTR|nr:replication protein [Cronobacter dublinensis]ALB67179.1 replication protein [Cronobacter dublinensis subsp. dublinensis LMG 23823]MDI7270774.1 replication protein [Cronobacter dublinensis]CCJ83501.1 putative phage replication protein [Cronobacter dublinensis 1210]